MKKVIRKDDQIIVERSFDKGKHLQHCKEMREAQRNQSSMGEMPLLYDIPMPVVIEINQKHNFDVLSMDYEDLPVLTKIVQTHYPYLMCIDGKFA